MRSLISAVSAIALTGCISAGAQTLEGVPSDTYSVDKTHAFLSASLSHGGLSTYTIDFTSFDANVAFNPETPTESSISFTVDPTGLDTQYPDPERKESWEEEISTDGKFLNAGEFPTVKFVSTSAETTGEFTGTLTGDFTLLGVTQPVTFDVTYRGVNSFPWDQGKKRIGFDAVGTIKRSDFGMTHLLNIGIGDEVTLTFSGEFVQSGE